MWGLEIMSIKGGGGVQRFIENSILFSGEPPLLTSHQGLAAV